MQTSKRVRNDEGVLNAAWWTQPESRTGLALRVHTSAIQLSEHRQHDVAVLRILWVRGL